MDCAASGILDKLESMRIARDERDAAGVVRAPAGGGGLDHFCVPLGLGAV
jgi:hypothetical protein